MNEKAKKTAEARTKKVSYMICFMVFFLSIPILHGQVNTNEEKNQQRSNRALNTNQHETPASTQGIGINEAEEKAASLTMTARGYYALFMKLFYQEKKSGKRLSPEKQQEVDQVIDKMGEQFPESFEYHYAKYQNGRLDTALAPHLFKALELAPNKKELYDDMAAFYELANQPAGKLRYCKLMKDQKVYPEMLLTYAENLFRSTEQGAWIFTQGEWDTYPAWIVQYAENKRKDLTILNLDMLQQPEYFKRVMKPFKLRKGAYEKFMTTRGDFFRDLATRNPDKPVYLTLTVDQTLIRDLKGMLYTTGLAMKLSAKPFNNLPILEKRWKSFDLQDLEKDQTDKSLYRMNGNYILPMGLLYKYYLEQGKTSEAGAFKKRMMNVAEKAGRKKEMEKWLKSAETNE